LTVASKVVSSLYISIVSLALQTAMAFSDLYSVYCTPYLCVVDDPKVQVLRPLGYLEDVHYQQLPLSPIVLISFHINWFCDRKKTTTKNKGIRFFGAAT
jgi:hypothetical protein